MQCNKQRTYNEICVMPMIVIIISYELNQLEAESD